jgi:hypothetical protein
MAIALASRVTSKSTMNCRPNQAVYTIDVST